MAMSLPRRRLGGVDRRGGGDTIRRVDDGANCCGEDADLHGGDDANSCGEDPDGHGGDDMDSCGEDPDGHGGNDADCSGEDPGRPRRERRRLLRRRPRRPRRRRRGRPRLRRNGRPWLGWWECHAGGVGCGGGGANVGGEKVGCPGAGRHTLPRRSWLPAGIRLRRREVRGRPLLGRHVGAAGDAEPGRLLRQRLPTRRAPASHGPSQIRPTRTVPRGARPGTTAGVTSHRSPPSVPAPGDHSPPERDSPL